MLALALAAGLAAPAAYHPGWEAALRRWVDDLGRVDFNAIREDPDGLRGQVAHVAETSPESFKSRDGKLAFLINAYNALAMSHAARSGILPASKVRFFYLSRHEVGGRKISLHKLENDVIRPLGEPKIHFVLNCMVRGCPRLPQEPFHPETIQPQLNKAAVEFLGSERHVQVDDAGRKVRLSSILKWYKDDFLAQAPSLLEYVNRYREKKIPLDYEVEFLPYDWTLNQR